MKHDILPVIVLILIVYLVAGGLVFWTFEKIDEKSRAKVNVQYPTSEPEVRPEQRYQNQNMDNCNREFGDLVSRMMLEIKGKEKACYTSDEVTEYLTSLINNFCPNDKEINDRAYLSSVSSSSLFTAATELPDSEKLRDFDLQNNSTKSSVNVVDRTVTPSTESILPRRCVHITPNGVSAPVQDETTWDLAGSIFFAMTVVTTIGYGSLVPTSDKGRTFCCFYAVVGIPLCLVVLVHVGQRITRHWQRLDKRLDRRFRSTCLGSNARSAIIVCIGIAGFLLIPSAVFMWIEGWSYATSVYYCVITLTTTGFGDYIAGFNGTKRRRPLLRAVYRLSIVIWILLGLAWLSVILNAIQQTFHRLLRKFELEPTDQNATTELLQNSEKISQPASICSHCACAINMTSLRLSDNTENKNSADEEVLPEELVRLKSTSDSKEEEENIKNE